MNLGRHTDGNRFSEAFHRRRSVFSSKAVLIKNLARFSGPIREAVEVVKDPERSGYHIYPLGLPQAHKF